MVWRIVLFCKLILIKKCASTLAKVKSSTHARCWRWDSFRRISSSSLLTQTGLRERNFTDTSLWVRSLVSQSIVFAVLLCKFRIFYCPHCRFSTSCVLQSSLHGTFSFWRQETERSARSCTALAMLLQPFWKRRRRQVGSTPNTVRSCVRDFQWCLSSFLSELIVTQVRFHWIGSSSHVYSPNLKDFDTYLESFAFYRLFAWLTESSVANLSIQTISTWVANSKLRIKILKILRNLHLSRQEELQAVALIDQFFA